MFGMIDNYNKLYVYKVVKDKKADYKIVFNSNSNYLETGILFDRFVTDVENGFPMYIRDIGNIKKLKVYVNRFGKPIKGIPFGYIPVQRQVVCKIKSLKKSGII